MAEFIEVARAKRRMCNAHKKKCSECKLQENCSLLNVCAYNDNEVKKLENEVMSWAAEHPEPQYPTWKEWLEEQRIVVHFDSVSEKGTKVKWELTNKSNCHIPVDIAQKLGIEPKEE